MIIPPEILSALTSEAFNEVINVARHVIKGDVEGARLAALRATEIQALRVQAANKIKRIQKANKSGK